MTTAFRRALCALLNHIITFLSENDTVNGRELAIDFLTKIGDSLGQDACTEKLKHPTESAEVDLRNAAQHVSRGNLVEARKCVLNAFSGDAAIEPATKPKSELKLASGDAGDEGGGGGEGDPGGDSDPDGAGESGTNAGGEGGEQEGSEGDGGKETKEAPPDVDRMNVKQLRDYADTIGCELPETATTKKDIREVIAAFLAA